MQTLTLKKTLKKLSRADHISLGYTFFKALFRLKFQFCTYIQLCKCICLKILFFYLYCFSTVVNLVDLFLH